MTCMTCMVCGAETGSSIVIAKKVRPLCSTCHGGWDASGERRRFAEQSAVLLAGVRAAGGRAFMDWLNRARAERRNERAA